MLTENQFQALLVKQEELENNSLALGAARFKRRLQQANDTGKGSTVGGAKRLLSEALLPTEAALVEMCAPKVGRPHIAKKWVEMVGAEVTAFIVTKVVLDGLAEGAYVRKAAAAVVDLMLDELRYRRFKEQAPALFKYRMNKFVTNSYAHMSRSMDAALSYANIDISDLTMTPSTKAIVGSHLIREFVNATGLVQIEVTKAPKDRLLTSNKKKYKSIRSEAFLVATPETSAWLDVRNTSLEMQWPVSLPMVVPPLPWSRESRGGYRFAMRGKQAAVRSTLRPVMAEALAADPLPVVYNALNRIQETAWKINQNVLSLVQAIIEEGSALAGIPAASDQQLPPKPADIATNEDAKYQWKKAAGIIRNENHVRKLQALSFHKTLSTAVSFKEEQAFFFPCNMDWRGRIYPIPNYLNFQGDDLSKALLTFAQGEPLGEDGAVWLATHGANSLGKTPEGLKLSTCTLQERVDWIVAHTNAIGDVATNPLGNLWWTEADEPLQFFAFCVEWAAYAQMQRAGKGADFVCSLPVAMDGTCNGLQHFAALLRDDIGGAAVNVTANERPQDIYQRIADMVLARLATDAVDNELSRLWLATGLVDRKLTKRPTMTFGYGSNVYGFKEQLFSYLQEQEKWPQLKAMFETTTDAGKADSLMLPACAYMGQLIWESLEKVVVAAFAGREWMQAAARLVTKSGNCVSWNVPLTGFPVRQQYLESVRSRVETTLAGSAYKPSVWTVTDTPNTHRQINGVAPNFIHSLDAAALMLAVEMASNDGVEMFSVVHDSYATLPSRAASLARATRQAFVRLHSADIMGDFAAQLLSQVPEAKLQAKFPAPPPRGNLDLSGVLVSDYFFS